MKKNKERQKLISVNPSEKKKGCCNICFLKNQKGIKIICIDFKINKVLS